MEEPKKKRRRTISPTGTVVAFIWFLVPLVLALLSLALLFYVTCSPDTSSAIMDWLF